jgi:hypothetical protein
MEYLVAYGSRPAIKRPKQDHQHIKRKLAASSKQNESTCRQAYNRTRVSGGRLGLPPLQPYRQKSVAMWKILKLFPIFFGPFLIMQKNGTVAYKLNLPNFRNTSIFNSFPLI